MKGKTAAKWLAVLLSVTMTAGTIPAYAAEVSDTDFSAEVSVEDTPIDESENSSETEPAEGQNEESEVDFSDDEFSDGYTEENMDSEVETEDAELTFSEEQDAGQSETREYLTNLTVYTGNDVSETFPMTRNEELDATFGGTTYTVEAGSNYNSSGFYVTADLAAAAPEGSTLKLSAYDLNGMLQETDMSASAYTENKRYNLSNIFAKGSKRAVYTITAGTGANSQTYKIVVMRRLDLSSIGCYLTTDTDLSKNLLTEFDTSGATREYEINVGKNVDKIKVRAVPFDKSWYGLTINGQTAADDSVKEIPLTGDETVITFQMKETGNYQDPAYSEAAYTSTGSYTVKVRRKENAAVTFQTTPEDAVVSVYDAKGERVTSSSGSAYIYDSLLYGDKYTWNVSKYGYISKRADFIAGEQTEIKVELAAQGAKQPETTDNDWTNFRNSDTNNGITAASTPADSSSAVQKWATRIGGGWEASITPPLVLGGYLYAAAGQFIYKIDKNTGKILATSEQLSGKMQYAMNPMTYAEGMLFAQIGGGQIQAVSASTLKSLWVSEKLGGQTLSPITYKDGYIYTGTWNSETTAGSYFCLSVTDEDPSTGNETKYCTWKYNHKGGFYWAGAYASSDYLVFGSDDGSREGSSANTSILYSVNTHTGQLLDKLTDLNGDIRSTVVYDNGYVYFTTKSGILYRIVMNADGTFGTRASYDLGGMATASPVVYKGRIYVGVCGKGGQFNADGGHGFAVLNNNASGISLAYKVSIPGYPQAAPLLSTAYENQDYNGDGKADGRVYLYFTYNAEPGGIYMLSDEPGQTSGKAEELFRPASEQQQYCISAICTDRDGTLYYKNDSNYLMAIETNGAYLDSVTAVADKGRINWDKAFQRSEKEHTVRIEQEASKVTLSFKAPAGCTITVNGQASNGTYVADVSSGKADITVGTTMGSKSREYVFHLTKDRGNSSLANLIVSTSNTYADATKYLNITPAFNSTKTEYTVQYLAGKAENNTNFLRVYPEPSDATSTVTAEKISGVSRISEVNSGQKQRFSVYWDDNADEAKIKIVVTAKAGSRTEYFLTIQRKEKVPTETPTPSSTPVPTETPEIFGPWQTVSEATVFASEVQRRTSNKGRQEERTVGRRLTPTLRLNATSIRLKVKQSTTKVKVSGLANGDYVKSWTSSNKKIATVTSGGKITGKKAGKAKIAVTLASGKKTVLNVTVQKTAVKTTKISGLKKNVSLKKGQKLALKPVISPITSLEKITYSISNKKVATVSKSGVITAKKKGTAKITVRSGKKSYVVKVTVK